MVEVTFDVTLAYNAKASLEEEGLFHGHLELNQSILDGIITTSALILGSQIVNHLLVIKDGEPIDLLSLRDELFVKHNVGQTDKGGEKEQEKRGEKEQEKRGEKEQEKRGEKEKNKDEENNMKLQDKVKRVEECELEKRYNHPNRQGLRMLNKLGIKPSNLDFLRGALTAVEWFMQLH